MGNSKPPSRRRYERENPTVSFRISREKKEELDRLVDAMEKTKKDWFEGVIEEERGRFSAVFDQGHTKGEKKGYEEGHDDGYEEGRRDGYQEFVATVPCADCSEPVAVNSEAQKEALFEAVERINAEWSAMPPLRTLECDIRHDECPEG